MSLKPTAQEQADSVVLRPSWCPFREYCIPVRRASSDLDMCFGVSRGNIISDSADKEKTFARICWLLDSDKPGDYNTLGFDVMSAAEFLEAVAAAHRAQVAHIYDDSEEETP